MLTFNSITKNKYIGCETIYMSQEVYAKLHVQYIENKNAVMTVIKNKLFPFNICKIIYESNKDSEMYFDYLGKNIVNFYYYDKKKNVVIKMKYALDTFHYDITLDNYVIDYNLDDFKLYYLNAGKILNSKTMNNVNNTINEITKMFSSIIGLFNYINTINLKEPIVETKIFKNQSKKKKFNNKYIKYISTKKYIISGDEDKKYKEIEKSYTMESWSTRGHWRKYKNGKIVWIKAHDNYRDKNILNCNINKNNKIYKVKG